MHRQRLLRASTPAAVSTFSFQGPRATRGLPTPPQLSPPSADADGKVCRPRLAIAMELGRHKRHTKALAGNRPLDGAGGVSAGRRDAANVDGGSPLLAFSLLSWMGLEHGPKGTLMHTRMRASSDGIFSVWRHFLAASCYLVSPASGPASGRLGRRGPSRVKTAAHTVGKTMRQTRSGGV